MVSDTGTFTLEEGRKEVMKGEHKNTVFSISFCSHFELAVTASGDGSAIVWEGEIGGTGWKVASKVEHPDMVLSAMFHPTLCDGLLFATSCDDGIVRLWRIVVRLLDGRNNEKGWELERVEGGDAPLTLSPNCGRGKGLAFSPCGSTLAVSFDDSSTVCIYSVDQACDESEEEERREEKKEGWPSFTLVAKLDQAHYYGWVARPALSSLAPHSVCMCTINGTNVQEVKVWRGRGVGVEKAARNENWASVGTLSTSSEVQRLAFASSFPCFSLCVSPFSAKQDNSGFSRGGKRMKQRKNGEECAATRSSAQETTCIDILAAACVDGTVIVWSVDTATSPPTFSSACKLSKEHTVRVLGLAFAVSKNGDATVLFSGDDNGQVCVWRGPPPSSLSASSPPEFIKVQSVNMGRKLHDIAISPFGSTFGAVQWEGAPEVQFWPCNNDQ